MSEFQGSDLARDGTGKWTGLAQLADRLAIANKHVRRSRRGRRLTAINGMDGARLCPNEHQATATDPGVMAIDHPEAQSSSDGRVDCVSPLRVHVGGGL